MSIAGALLYGLANLLHPRMLWLMVWPMLVSLTLWGVAAFALWGRLALWLAQRLQQWLEPAAAFVRFDLGDAALIAAHVLLFLLFVPLTVIPGPNVPALYFSFRAVAHYFSMRGARQGLQRVEWTPVPSKPLTEVRRTLDMERQERRTRIDTIARELDLERLAGFVDRIKGAQPPSAKASADNA